MTFWLGLLSWNMQGHCCSHTIWVLCSECRAKVPWYRAPLKTEHRVWLDKRHKLQPIARLGLTLYNLLPGLCRTSSQDRRDQTCCRVTWPILQTSVSTRQGRRVRRHCKTRRHKAVGLHLRKVFCHPTIDSLGCVPLPVTVGETLSLQP